MIKARPPKNIWASRGRRQTLWLHSLLCVLLFMQQLLKELCALSPWQPLGSGVRKWKGWIDEFVEEFLAHFLAAVQWYENLTLKPAGQGHSLMGIQEKKLQFWLNRENFIKWCMRSEMWPLSCI